MIAEELVRSTINKPFSLAPAMLALRTASGGAIEDVLNTNGSAYYQWLPKLIEATNPQQVVELGGAMGVSAIMMCQTLKGKLYSITLPEHGLEFSFVVDKYPNLVQVLGDDLDLNNWPKDLDLKKTDIWFFDALHTPEHLIKELDLYSPFFKKGAIVLVDDIHSFDLDQVWDKLKEGKWGDLDCYDGTDPLHFTGFGVCIKL